MDQNQIETQENEKKTSTIRRDKLIYLQKQAQELWKSKNFHKCIPFVQDKKKFFSTFPYPYVNGKLHLGHAFSISKNEFMTSQAFHCTGMPISAAARRLKEEYEKYGSPPNLPILSEEQIKKQGMFQFQIMKKMNIPEEEIKKFIDPNYWLQYYPPIAQNDLDLFGLHSDWRRSFITTEQNPYYDSFIQWQFFQLQQNNHIRFGKRPSIYSVKDQQMCADHDRSEGENIMPQQYTLIKIQILEPFPQSLNQIAGRKVFLIAATLRPETMYGQTNCYILPTGIYGAFEMKDNEIFICSDRSALNLAYQECTKEDKKIEKICDIKGQNLIGLPLKAPLSCYDKIYAWPMFTISMEKGTGIVTSVPSDSPDDYACLRDLVNKPALRQKFGLQDDQVLPFKPVPIIQIEGFSNMAAVDAVTQFKIQSGNEKDKLNQAKELVYKKGFYSGVMTAGDFAGQKVEIAKKLTQKLLCETKQGLIYYEPESEVISKTGDKCIVALCDQWYLTYSDEEWKQKLHKHIKSDNFTGYNQHTLKELDATVDWLQDWGCSRSFGLGTHLPWDKQYLIESLSDSTIYMAYYTISYLLQGDMYGKSCGELGILPEQLNNYVWSYIFLKGEYNENCKQIPEEKLKRLKDEFEYWYPLDLRCSGKDLIKNHLTMMMFNHASIWKNREDLWPRSIFCNGWILVNGDKMSKGKGNFFTIEEAIEKYGADSVRLAIAQSGDTIDDANFTFENAESSILNLSTLEMFIRETVKLILDGQLRSEYNGINDPQLLQKVKFFDQVFENEMKFQCEECKIAYGYMKFRDVIKFGFFELVSVRDEYRVNLQDIHIPMNKDLIIKYILWQLLLIYPIVPHFSEILYHEQLYKTNILNKNDNPEFISFHQMPRIYQDDINHLIVREHLCLKVFLRNARISFDKWKKSVLKMQQKKDKNFTLADIQLKKMKIFVAKEYNNWQIKVLKILNNIKYEIVDDSFVTHEDWRRYIKDDGELSQEIKKKCFQFGQMVLDDLQQNGKRALEMHIPYNELKMLELFESRIKVELKVNEIEFVVVHDSSDQHLSQVAINCMPGRAQVQFE